MLVYSYLFSISLSIFWNELIEKWHIIEVQIGRRRSGWSYKHPNQQKQLIALNKMQIMPVQKYNGRSVFDTTTQLFPQKRFFDQYQRVFCFFEDQKALKLRDMTMSRNKMVLLHESQTNICQHFLQGHQEAFHFSSNSQKIKIFYILFEWELQYWLPFNIKWHINQQQMDYLNRQKWIPFRIDSRTIKQSSTLSHQDNINIKKTNLGLQGFLKKHNDHLSVKDKSMLNRCYSIIAITVIILTCDLLRILACHLKEKKSKTFFQRNSKIP